MTTDARAEKLADLVLDYSVSLTHKDRLLIQYDSAFSSYANIIAQQAAKRGADIEVDHMMHTPTILRGLIERNDPKEWRKELKRRKKLAAWCTSRILIDCDSDPNYARGIPNAQEILVDFTRKVIGPYKEVLYRPGPHDGYDVKWNIVGFPCDEGAKGAGMHPSQFADFVYAATLGNKWDEMKKNMQLVKRTFDAADCVHIYVPGLTDLRFSIKGRGGDICDGKCNMPDGEVFYGPIEDSMDGYITFQCPSKREGIGVVEGIRLEFANGRIVKHSAKTNEEGLTRMLDTDAGSRRIGEFGIGCNYGIKRAITETLFDEKIGGTIHLAIGDSFRKQPFSAGGGLNKSDIHWDLVCDLRKNLEEDYLPGGQITLDGRIVQQDGQWFI